MNRKVVGSIFLTGGIMLFITVVLAMCEQIKIPVASIIISVLVGFLYIGIGTHFLTT